MHLDLKVKHALLLQGPVGPFFRRFAEELVQRGIAVTKVNFNAGDGLFYRSARGRDVISYRGRLEDWPAALRKIIAERGIDAVFLFGDCRPIHVAARQLCRELELPAWCFEEGYLRPDYVTVELGGVNGNSSLPKDPAFYPRATEGLPPLPDPRPIGNAFGIHALWTAFHSLACTFMWWRYPRYRHHRTVNSFYQAFCWVRGAWRKTAARIRERGVLERLVRDHDKRYWFVPLQVHCDSQLSHSDYPSMEKFIDEAVETFVAHAPAGDLLVIKHHPHDMPYKDYGRYLRRLGERLGCSDRLIYVHELHVPTLLKHARGCITINSTVGTSALFHHTPTKVMGRAIYDLPGLTCQRSLASFFAEPGEVDVTLYEHFNRWLREANQINGSFYKRALGTVSGLDPAVFVAKARVDAVPALQFGKLESHDHLAP